MMNRSGRAITSFEGGEFDEVVAVAVLSMAGTVVEASRLRFLRINPTKLITILRAE